MLRRASIGLAATALLLAPATAGVAATAPTDPTGTQLQRLLTAEHDAGMPGVFAKVRDGRRTWSLAAGVADIESGRPARPGMQQRVGSITKTFTATTVLQLVGEGRIRLDAPIARYLPGLLPSTLGRQVTVRMLLNHTSGIADYVAVIIPEIPDVEEAQFRTYAPRELVRLGLSRPPTNAPGAAWSYSNTGYIILGLLIEKVTGHRYADEVNRRIVRPLHLRETYLPGTNPYLRGPHMAAYIPWTDGNLRDFSVFNMSMAWAAGELISTAGDLNTFYRALLTGRLLAPSLLRQMTTTVPIRADAPDAGGYGLGIYWSARPCGRVWGHNGGVVGQTTDSFHSRDGRRQVTVAQNLNVIVPEAVDEAHRAFLTAAACGPQPDTRTTSITAGQLPAALRADLAPVR